MNIATYNVNSVRTRLPRLIPWLKSASPDVVCLQEIKVVDEKFPREDLEALGYHLLVHGQPTYNGVAIFSRVEADEVRRGLPGDDEDTQARFISARVSGVTVINVYVPNGSEVGSDKYAYKLRWLERLREYLDARHRPEEPLVICGDFNIAPDDRDVYDPGSWEGKVLCSKPERAALGRLLDWGLSDALRHHTEAGEIYTWWDYRGGSFWKNQGLRIDHFLVTDPVADRLSAVTVHRDERKGEKPSDHAPVVMQLD